ncbi:MAG: ROK family transcriptional regulator [Clostridia bacterium]|nr:ROK family transcriptional regulator [Clostridia bacterium]
MYYQRVDKFLLARSNKQSVFRCIINEGPINKSAIASKVGLTIPSVMKIVDSLDESGLVRNIGKGVSSGGKPPMMLEVIPDSHYALGIDIGLSETRYIIGDMQKNIIAKYTTRSGNYDSVDELVESLSCNVEKLVERSSIDKKRLLGVGIGAPGLIDCNTGEVLFSPHLSWKNINLREKFSERLQYPVYIENVTKNVARAEYDIGAGRGAKYVFNLNLGRGIAGAFVIDGNIYYGANGLCGEIGHLTVNREGPMCKCGNYGCLEVMASGEAIAQQAKDAVARGVSSRMLEMANGSAENIDAKLVFSACELGDEPAKMIVERALEYIGIALAGVLVIFDVERVIITGGLTKNGNLFWDTIKANIIKHLMKYSGMPVDIVPAALGDDAAALGAICHIIQQYIMTL